MKNLILLLSFCILLFPVEAKNDPAHLSPNVWKEVMRDVDYSKSIEKEQEKKPEEEKQQNQQNPGEQSVKKNKTSPSGIIQMIAYVLGIGLLIAILIWIITRFNGSASVKTIKRIEAKSLEEAEENLPMLSLNTIFQEAIDSKSFKQAMRIKFLMILQQLIDLGHVNWKKSKTNMAYISELKDENIRQPFSQLVDLFDDVWYGEKELSESLFQESMSKIDWINQKIQQVEQ